MVFYITRIFTPIALLCVLLGASVSAKPEDDGYKWAKGVWDEKDYDCSHDDLEKFWQKVKKHVYKWCKDEFSGNDEDECKEGAEDFVDKNEKDCAFEYGYDKAGDMWDRRSYDCSRNDLNDFEDDVRKDVFYDCEEEYKKDYGSEIVESCEDGALEYINYKGRNCDNWNGGGGGGGDAYDYGYREAERLWSYRRYRCNKNDLEDFWREVEDSIFEDCDKRYSGSRRDECEAGAFAYMGCRD